ncbi:MAG: beta strand repeat-containing protein, partial [Alphaproteobacteria bacterium]
MANFTGTTGNDTITGTTDADVIDALGGNDSIVALAGADLITLGSGQDTVDAGGGDDTVNAGGFSENISNSSSFTKTIDGGAGTDTVLLRSDFGSPTQVGGTLANVERVEISRDTGAATSFFVTPEFVSADTEFAIDPNLSLFISADGTTADLTDARFVFLDGSPGAPTVSGTTGNDSIIGSSTAFNIFLGLGQDTFAGGSADETINLGGFSENISNSSSFTKTIDGGAGTDTVLLRSDFGSPTRVGGTLANVERVEISGNTGAATSFFVTPEFVSADTEFAIDPNLSLFILADGTTVDLTNARFVFLDGSPGAPTVFGTSGNDSIIGSATAFSIFLGRGQDTFAGGSADETINLGGFSENISNRSSFTKTIDGGAGTDTVLLRSDLGSPTRVGGTLANVERVEISRVGNASTTFNVTPEFLSTTATFAIDPNLVLTLIGNGSVTDLTNAQFAFLDGSTGTPALRGSSSAEEVIGNANALSIDLQGGNDSFTGGAGNETVTGGSGTDTIRTGAGDDVIDIGAISGTFVSNETYDGGTGTDRLTATLTSDTLDLTQVALTGIEEIGISGSGSRVVILTAAQIGALTRIEGATEVRVEGAGTVDLSGVTVLDGNGNAGRVVLDAQDQVVISPSTSLLLDGGAGGDVLDLSALGGTPTVDSAAGTVTFTNASGTLVTITFTNVETVTTGNPPSQFDGDTLDNNLVGTLDADILNGFAGNDVISGLGGNDTITGGEDRDVIRGGFASDSIDAGPGPDSVLGDEGSASEGQSDTIVGGEGDDTLFGNGGDDSLTGDAGADSLFGEDGNDTLRGGTENDTLDGGNGDDSLE